MTSREASKAPAGSLRDDGRRVFAGIRRLLDRGQQRQLLFVSLWAGALSLLEMLVAAMVIPYVQCLGNECSPRVESLAAGLGLSPVILLTLMLFVLVTAKLLTEAGLAWRSAGFAQRVKRETVMALLGRYLHMNWPDFQRQNRNHYYRRCAVTAVDAARACYHCVNILSASLVIVFLTALMIWQNPPVSLALIAGFALINRVTQRLIARSQRHAAERREDGLRHWNLGMAEAFGSFREIRVYGIEAFFLRHIEKATRTVSDSTRRLDYLPVLPRMVMDFAVLSVLLVIVSVWLMLDRPIAALLPQLIFYAVVARTLLPAMMQVASSRATLRGSMINVELVLEELEQAGRAARGQVAVTPTAAAQPAFGLDRVSLAFGDHPVLREASLHLPHPGWIALTGPSGAGKSTLMELLCGLRGPDQGEVFHHWPAGAPRIAYVPQAVALLDDTVAGNVVFGFDAGDPGRIREAIRLACLEARVAALPQGSDTPIGPDGTRLSGGQRQRLAIARALYRQPDLLLLDEATSGLDEATESELLAGLRAARPAMSVVLVTHRPASQAFVDRVYRIEDGRVSETVP